MRRVVASALFVSVLSLAACAGCESSPAPAPSSASVPVQDAAPRLIPLSDAGVRALEGAELAFVGRIVAVGPSPGVWSGILATCQPVEFEVVRRLDHGPRAWPAAGDHVSVWFGIVGPPDCDRSAPELDPRIYRVGATGVVAASLGGSPVGGSPVGGETVRHLVAWHAAASFHETAPGSAAEAWAAHR